MDELYQKYLIKKYLDGTATPAERDELLLWYRAKGEEDFEWPYESQLEEDEAKARIFDGLQQRIKAAKAAEPTTRNYFYKIAAAASVVLAVCIGLLWHNNSKPVRPQSNTVVTKPGERKIINLVDGSVIWLGSGSSVTYPVAFVGTTREISFEGEAFFDIAKDKHHPFIVHTGTTSTRVLGTTFNISSFKSHKEIVVALVTGKVSFTDGGSGVLLSPTNMVVYNKLKKTTKVLPIPDLAAVMGRRNGYYEYRNVLVKDIAEDVSRNFNMKIQVVGEVKNTLFFGRIKPGESPVQFLKKMALVVHASLISKDNLWIIKGGGDI
jgi:ferric-dicitrate binding protein FerR (iron transport regulator)